eukprot:EG_transcript_6916
MPLFEGNVGLAVGISVGAGLSTLFGAIVLFLPKNFRERHFSLILGISLAVASGVMLYVSFAEIYFKALDAAALALDHQIEVDVGFDHVRGEAITERKVYGFTFPTHWSVSLLVNGTVFGGMLLAVTMDYVIHKFAPEVEGLEAEHVEMPGCAAEEHDVEAGRAGIVLDQQRPEKATAAGCLGAGPLATQSASPKAVEGGKLEIVLTMPEEALHSDETEAPSVPEESNKEAGHELTAPVAVPRSKLKNLGLLSVLAIGLHNLPEGLATFTACLDTPSVGLPLAVGIALHNIPEGICVAVPIYFATGSRWKAIFWTFISGVMEPIGGILGYMALKEVIGDMTYAIIFGVVTGMMIQIVINEYLPVCHKLPIPKILIVLCVIGGMVIMWLSILILNL